MLARGRQDNCFQILEKLEEDSDLFSVDAQGELVLMGTNGTN